MKQHVVAFLAFLLLISTSAGQTFDDGKCYYKSRFIFHTASTDCQGGFCCGTCDNRYCCTDPALYLNQTVCSSCSGYSDDAGLIWFGEECDPSQNMFCCGTCEQRYCCRRLTRALNQSECSNNVQIMPPPPTPSAVSSSSKQSDGATTAASVSTTTSIGNEQIPVIPYSFFYDPSMLWLKILIIVIPFVIVAMLTVSIVSWNKLQASKRRARARKMPAPPMLHRNPSQPASASSSALQPPVSVIRSISAMVTTTEGGNIQDIHTMYNDDLSLVVPNYETVQHQGAELRTVEGPFIYPSSDDLPKYDNIK